MNILVFGADTQAAQVAINEIAQRSDENYIHGVGSSEEILGRMEDLNDYSLDRDPIRETMESYQLLDMKFDQVVYFSQSTEEYVGGVEGVLRKLVGAVTPDVQGIVVFDQDIPVTDEASAALQAALGTSRKVKTFALANHLEPSQGFKSFCQSAL